MWKKIIVAICLLLLLIITIWAGQVRGDSTMDGNYIEVYDRDLEHLGNIQVEKWKVIRRVYDFDSSSFEGYCDKDITSGMVFVFRSSIGDYYYSGFMKNITQTDDGLVKFKGDDLRRIFDTEILLDYSQERYYEQAEDVFSLENIYRDVRTKVEANVSSYFTISTSLPGSTVNLQTQFIANPSGTYQIVNAWKYLKPYFAFYGYYIEVYYDGINLNIVVKESTETESIRLPDFIFSKTTSETKTNHIVARIKPADNQLTTKAWVYSSKEVYDATPASLQHDIDYGNIGYPETWGPTNFEDSFEDFERDYVIRVRLYPGTVGVGNPSRTFYMQPVTNYSKLPTAFVTLEYWLGNDNQVYYNSIPSDKKILPVVTKYLEAEYLSDAQFKGVYELVNSRYVEYIILSDSTNIPIDIKDLVLYEMVTVYDANGDVRTLPVSEIEWTQDGYSVKLGFKKTLLTEIIKN